MSISISKHIYAKLSASDELKQLVEDRIYPISSKESTFFPFVVYSRSSLTPNYTKDRHDTGDTVTVEIIAASDNYLNSVEVAEAIRRALENNRGKYEAFDVESAKVIASVEDFVSDTFIQRITFEFETESNY